MDRLERIIAVNSELSGAVRRVIAEYDMTYAEIIGIMEMLKLNLYEDAKEA